MKDQLMKMDCPPHVEVGPKDLFLRILWRKPVLALKVNTSEHRVIEVFVFFYFLLVAYSEKNPQFELIIWDKHF